MPRYLVERSFPDGLAVPVDRITEVRVLDPYFYGEARRTNPRRHPMSKLARPLMLVAMLAAMNLAAMTAVAQAHTSNDSASTRHRALGRVEFLATDQPSGQADATVRRLLARERSTIPNAAPTHPRLLLDEERSSLLNIPNGDAADRTALGQERYYSTWGYGGVSAPAAPAEPSGQPAWLVIALAVLAAVLALVAGVAVLAARRATRSQHAGQTA